MYALGLIVWCAFYPSIALASWLGPATAGALHALAVVAFLAMIGLAFTMTWHSDRALAALGLPILTFGLARLQSAPWQVNVTIWAPCPLVYSSIS